MSKWAIALMSVFRTERYSSNKNKNGELSELEMYVVDKKYEKIKLLKLLIYC